VVTRLSHQPLSGQLGYGAQWQSRALGAERSEGTLDGREHRKIIGCGGGWRLFLSIFIPEPFSQKHPGIATLGDRNPISPKIAESQFRRADFAMLPSALLISLLGLGACLGPSKWVLLSPNRHQFCACASVAVTQTRLSCESFQLFLRVRILSSVLFPGRFLLF
jgi:hypothetical protein